MILRLTENMLSILDNLKRLPRRPASHAHVILSASRSRKRIRRWRVAKHFVLRNERTCRYMRHHKTRIDASLIFYVFIAKKNISLSYLLEPKKREDRSSLDCRGARFDARKCWRGLGQRSLECPKPTNLITVFKDPPPHSIKWRILDFYFSFRLVNG